MHLGGKIRANPPICARPALTTSPSSSFLRQARERRGKFQRSSDTSHGNVKDEKGTAKSIYRRPGPICSMVLSFQALELEERIRAISMQCQAHGPLQAMVPNGKEAARQGQRGRGGGGGGKNLGTFVKKKKKKT